MWGAETGRLDPRNDNQKRRLCCAFRRGLQDTGGSVGAGAPKVPPQPPPCSASVVNHDYLRVKKVVEEQVPAFHQSLEALGVPAAIRVGSHGRSAESHLELNAGVGRWQAQQGSGLPPLHAVQGSSRARQPWRGVVGLHRARISAESCGIDAEVRSFNGRPRVGAGLQCKASPSSRKSNPVVPGSTWWSPVEFEVVDADVDFGGLDGGVVVDGVDDVVAHDVG